MSVDDTYGHLRDVTQHDEVIDNPPIVACRYKKDGAKSNMKACIIQAFFFYGTKWHLFVASVLLINFLFTSAS